MKTVFTRDEPLTWTRHWVSGVIATSMTPYSEGGPRVAGLLTAVVLAAG